MTQMLTVTNTRIFAVIAIIIIIPVAKIVMHSYTLMTHITTIIQITALNVIITSPMKTVQLRNMVTSLNLCFMAIIRDISALSLKLTEQARTATMRERSLILATRTEIICTCYAAVCLDLSAVVLGIGINVIF